jgi:uncharacterized protein YvpB
MDFEVKSEKIIGLLPWATKITISPKTTLPPGGHFIFYLSDINGPLFHKYGEQMINVTTRSVDVASIEPQDGSVVAANQMFTVRLTETISNVREWSVMVDPPAIFYVEIADNQTLNFRPSQPLRQGSKYQLTFVENPIISDRATGKEVNHLGATTKKVIGVTTANAVDVKSLMPQDGGVDPNADIAITFQESMNKASVEKNITVSPAFTFGTKWENNDTKITLVNKPLEKDTEYTISLAKGTQTAKGGLLEAEISYHFHTAGPLKLEKSTPNNDAVEAPQKTSVSLVFDQNITDQTGSSITITPSTPGKVSVSGNKYQFIPDNQLLTDTKYTVTIPAGTSGTYGLPSSQPQTVSFSTIPNLTLLEVPYFHQDTLFTCNISAARMLLSYRGISVTEQQIIDTIGTGGPRGEGNPHKGYVNNYGTYWDAVSRGVATLRPIRMISSGKLADIIAELKKGNPVMTWGQNGWSTPRDISWTSTDGTFIHAINGMHSTVVRGFSGPENNPTEIYLNDPWRGQYAIATSEFMRRWNYFLMAMVVD